MRSTVSMTLAPAVLVIVSRIAGCLPNQAASRDVGDAVDHARRRRPAAPMAPFADLQHQRPVVLAVLELAVDADGFRAVRPLEPADRPGDVGGADGVVDVLRRQPAAASAAGSSRTRTAGFSAPLTVHLRHARPPATAAAPGRCRRRRRSAPRDSVSEVSAIVMIGASAGLNLRKNGPRRQVATAGRACAALIAACTSCAAPSMSRPMSNCTMIAGGAGR